MFSSTLKLSFLLVRPFVPVCLIQLSDTLTVYSTFDCTSTSMLRASDARLYACVGSTIPRFAGWRTVTLWLSPSALIVTVAVRSSYVVFWLHLTVTVTGPSEAVPDDGDTLTQESDELAVQSRFDVNVIDWLPPSALSSTEPELDKVREGSFWHPASNIAPRQIIMVTRRFIGACVIIFSK